MSLGVLPPFRSSGQRSSTGIFPHGPGVGWGQRTENGGTVRTVIHIEGKRL